VSDADEAVDPLGVLPAGAPVGASFGEQRLHGSGVDGGSGDEPAGIGLVGRHDDLGEAGSDQDQGGEVLADPGLVDGAEPVALNGRGYDVGHLDVLAGVGQEEDVGGLEGGVGVEGGGEALAVDGCDGGQPLVDDGGSSHQV